MKQTISRDAQGLLRDLLGVYLPEGAPLVDSDWNEQADIGIAHIRALARTVGVEGTCGPELAIRVVPGAEASPGLAPSDILIGGGPGPFFAGGLPLSWPDDVRLGDQGACCAMEQRAPLDGPEWTAYLRTWVEVLDRQDVPTLVDPALSGEAAPFRKALRGCVSIAEGRKMPRPVQTSLLLTLEGSYLGDVNALFWIEMSGISEDGASAKLLWDDENASVSTQLAVDAMAGATELRVADTAGFEVGHVLRIEGCPGDGAAYRVTGVDTSALQISRLSCDSPPEVPEDDGCGGAASPSAQSKYAPADGEGQPRSATATGEGLTSALSLLDEARATTLGSDVPSFSYCVPVLARSDWGEGMEVEIAAGPMAESTVDDDGCWPTQAPRPAPERRRILKIFRCSAESGEPEVMILRLDHPTSHAHGAGTQVLPVRRIRVRRYRDLVCDVPIHRPDDCAGGTDGPCCHGAPLRLGPHLNAYLTVPQPEEVRAHPGDGWRFAVRAGGSFEPRARAPVAGTERHHTPLARLSYSAEEGWQVEDLRPSPPGCDLRDLLGPLAQATGEITATALTPTQTDAAAQVSALARIGRPTAEQWDALNSALSALANADTGSALVDGLLGHLEGALPEEPWDAAPPRGALAIITSIVERLALAVAMVGSGCCPGEEEEPTPGESPPPEEQEPPPEEQEPPPEEQEPPHDELPQPEEEEPPPEEQEPAHDELPQPDEEEPAHDKLPQPEEEEPLHDEIRPPEEEAPPPPEEESPPEAQEPEEAPKASEAPGEPRVILGTSLFHLRIAEGIPSSTMRAIEGRWPTVGDLLEEPEPLRGSRQLEVQGACQALLDDLRALLPFATEGEEAAAAIDAVWDRHVASASPPRAADIVALAEAAAHGEGEG